MQLTASDVPSVGTVLVNSDGMTVYAAEQETAQHLRCTDACAAIWLPVTVPADAHPSAGQGVTAKLGTVTRPDGEIQVTADGSPLYTFSLEDSPDASAGNGVMDTFGGTDFTWHAVTPGGKLVKGSTTSMPASPSTSQNSDDGSYRY